MCQVGYNVQTQCQSIYSCMYIKLGYFMRVYSFSHACCMETVLYDVLLRCSVLINYESLFFLS
jgi:hypothetical protein